MGSPEKPLTDVEMGDMGQTAETDKLTAPDVDIKSGEKEESKEEERFTGLKKEELLEASSKKKWVVARWVLFIIFWAGWVGMLVGAIIIVVKAPRCKAEPTPPWYQDTIVYDADLKKFAGGDLKVLKDHLGYVKSLNAKTLTVSNVNDPQDLQKVIDDATANFSELVSQSHSEDKQKDLKVVVDLRIDVLSTGSARFKESATVNCTGVNCNLFTWKSNASVPGSDAGGKWVYHPDREENYRVTNEDDSLAFVNYASPEATNYISEVVKNWVEYGADGFQLGDMAQVDNPDTFVEAIQNTLNETQANLEDKDKKVIGLFLMSSDVEKQFELFPEGNETASAPVVINTALSKIDTSTTGVGKRIQDLVTDWRSKTKPFIGAIAMNTMSQYLLAERLSPKQAAGLTLLSYTIPGVPVLRSGDEALLVDDTIIWDTSVKEKDDQKPRNASESNLKVISKVGNLIGDQYRSLQSLRWDNVDSIFAFNETNSTEVIAFTRKWDTKATVLVVSNPTDKEVIVEIEQGETKSVDKVLVASGTEIGEDDKFPLDALKLEPGRTFVFQLKNAR